MRLRLTLAAILVTLSAAPGAEAATIHARGFDAGVPSKVTARMLADNGFKVRVTCTRACVFSGTLVINASDAAAMGFRPKGFEKTFGVVVARVERRLRAGTPTAVRYRISRTARRRIARARKSFRIEGTVLAGPGGALGVTGTATWKRTAQAS